MDRPWRAVSDFYRCRKCLRVLTDLQMNRHLSIGESPCPCGGLHFASSNPPPTWWLRPACLQYAWFKFVQTQGTAKPDWLPRAVANVLLRFA